MLRSKRLLGLAVSCGMLLAGLVFVTPSVTPEVHADGPTPTLTPTQASGGGGGTGGNGNGGGGHIGGS